LPFGGVVGVAELVDCVARADLDTDDPFAVGPWCWVLSNARAFAKPVPFSGQLSWFEVPDELVDEALATAAVAPTVVRVRANTLVWPPQGACWCARAEGEMPLGAEGLAAPYCFRCLGHLPGGKPLHAIRMDEPHPVTTYGRQVLPGDDWKASENCADLGPAVRVMAVGGVGGARPGRDARPRRPPGRPGGDGPAQPRTTGGRGGAGGGAGGERPRGRP